MIAPVIDVDVGLQSNFATVYNNDQNDQPQEEPNCTPLQFSERLLSNYERNYMKKFPFEKGQYHQCIPNPHLPDEFITVMLVDRGLELNRIDRTTPVPFRNTQGRVLSKTYEEYDIVDPNELDDEGGQGEGEGEDEYMRQGSEEVPGRKSVMKGGLYADENLWENVDEIEGVENKEFARLLKRQTNPEAVDDKQVAVIGFWRLNKT